MLVVASAWLPVGMVGFRPTAVAGAAGATAAAVLADGIHWPVSMWLGAVVLSSAVAAGLALLSSWSRMEGRQAAS